MSGANDQGPGAFTAGDGEQGMYRIHRVDTQITHSSGDTRAEALPIDDDGETAYPGDQRHSDPFSDDQAVVRGLMGLPRHATGVGIFFRATR